MLQVKIIVAILVLLPATITSGAAAPSHKKIDLSHIYGVAATGVPVTFYIDDQTLEAQNEQIKMDLKFVCAHHDLLSKLSKSRDLRAIDDYCQQLRMLRDSYLQNQRVTSFHLDLDEMSRPQGLIHWAPEEKDVMKQKAWDEYEFECRWSLVHAERGMRDLDRDCHQPKRNNNSKRRKKLRKQFNYNAPLQQVLNEK